MCLRPHGILVRFPVNSGWWRAFNAGRSFGMSSVGGYASGLSFAQMYGGVHGIYFQLVTRSLREADSS